MFNTLVFGWIYATFSFINRLPQIARNYERKQTDDLSVSSYICQVLGLLFFFLHGLSIGDPVIIVNSIIVMLQTLIIMSQMWMYYSHATVAPEPPTSINRPKLTRANLQCREYDVPLP